MKTADLEIQGMTCNGCVRAVRQVLTMPGVDALDVQIGRATMRFDDAQVTEAKLREAVEGAGFDVAASRVTP